MDTVVGLGISDEYPCEDDIHMFTEKCLVDDQAIITSVPISSEIDVGSLSINDKQTCVQKEKSQSEHPIGNPMDLQKKMKAEGNGFSLQNMHLIPSSTSSHTSRLNTLTNENVASLEAMNNCINSSQGNPQSIALCTPPESDRSSSTQDESFGEGEDSVGATLVSKPASKSKLVNRPGVILLGRGNSFSLGRSEVIFLNNTRSTKRKLIQPRSLLKVNGSSRAENIVQENQHGPSPPELSTVSRVHPDGTSTSNGVKSTLSSGANRTEANLSMQIESDLNSESPSFEEMGRSQTQKNETDRSLLDELDALWAHAELVMASKQKVVLEKLAEFGVGSGGDDVATMEEEDRVWGIVDSVS